MAASEKPDKEEGVDEKCPHYKCINEECRAKGAMLEDDEVVKNEMSGGLTCCYCGGELEEAPE